MLRNAEKTRDPLPLAPNPPNGKPGAEPQISHKRFTTANKSPTHWESVKQPRCRRNFRCECYRRLQILVSVYRCSGSKTDPTLLFEVGIVRENVQRKGVIPSVDELDGFVEIVDGNDGQNRCKNFTVRSAIVRATATGDHNPWTLTRSLRNHQNQRS